jgi:hypothetical protein
MMQSFKVKLNGKNSQTFVISIFDVLCFRCSSFHRNGHIFEYLKNLVIISKSLIFFHGWFWIIETFIHIFELFFLPFSLVDYG